MFTLILSQGHHLLCRAKSNAVFYQIPTRPKQPKQGRPRRYGNRVHLPYLKYRDIVVKNETLSVADKIVRTKMCPEDVRLVVIRIRKKKSKPYQYFCLFTSDGQLSVADVIRHYKNRWKIETAFRDVKQNFGFDTYQIRKRPSLNRFAQLSFVAASLTQLIFTNTVSDIENEDVSLGVADVLLALNMHWYKAKHLTRGLMTAYLRQCFQQQYFSASNDPKQNLEKNLKIDEDTT